MQLSPATHPAFSPRAPRCDGPGSVERKRATLLPMAARLPPSDPDRRGPGGRGDASGAAAAAGDGGGFATLYERYERRAYNLAYRLTAPRTTPPTRSRTPFLNVLRRLPKLEGRELDFGSYLFTATRNASYDLMQKRKRAEPSDAIPETAAPIGARRAAASASTPAIRTRTPTASCCSSPSRTRSAPPTSGCRSASARRSRCASSRSCPTTRSPRSWT